MISFNKELNCIFLSRCDYLYRDGINNRDVNAYNEMGDGDIVIPLPENMVKSNEPKSDFKSMQIILNEVQNILKSK